MIIFENIALAFSGLWANKMRALLTMLGIIIGIGSVIGIVTVGNSMTNSLTTSMQSMGANNITVTLTQKSDTDYTQGGMTYMFGFSRPDDSDLITDDMIAQYREAYPNNVQYVTMTESVGDGTIANGAEEESVSLLGTNTEYADANSIELITGRYLNSYDVEKKKMVAVVSDYLCLALFPGQDPIGKAINVTVGGSVQTYYIVGVYSYEGSTSSSSVSTSMYVPISTAQRLNGSSAGYQSFSVVSTVDTDTTAFLTTTQNFFVNLYARNQSYTCTASSMESIVETMSTMLSTISTAIAVIAGISLLVGGIGVMNIMLVSITERTREIGTRKALGATNGSIRIQFIVESVIICLTGGILGIFAGVGLGFAGANMLGYAAAPSMAVIVIAVGFSMVIGVFFGYYPANKAAKMNPIEALRYE